MVVSIHNTASYIWCIISLLLWAATAQEETQQTPQLNFCDAPCDVNNSGTCYATINDVLYTGAARVWIKQSIDLTAPQRITSHTYVHLMACEAVTVQCAGIGTQAFVVRDVDDLRVQGFTITNCTQGAIDAVVRNTATLERMDIQGPSSTMLRSAVSLSGESAMVNNCTFDGNKQSVYASSASKGGALRMDMERAVLINNAFTDNAAVDGAGVYAEGHVTAEDCVFANNSCREYGCGLRADSVTLKNSLFSNNNGPEIRAIGGAVYSYSDMNATNVTCIDHTSRDGSGLFIDRGKLSYIKNSRFERNYADEKGASVRSKNGGLVIDACVFIESHSDLGGAVHGRLNVTVTNSAFNSTTAQTHGGAVYSHADIVVRMSTFSNSMAANSGGSLYTNDGAVVVTNSSFVYGSANIGGAVYGYNVSIVSSNISYSDAEQNGGAVFAKNVAQFYRGVCLGNSAGSSGGAAYANNVLVNNSVFDGNQCGTNGGAIYSGESLDATLGHFADNLAVVHGGSVYTKGSSTLNTCEFKGNEAQDRGGAVYTHFANISSGLYSNNKAKKRGGAVYATLNVYLHKGVFAGNSAGEPGGAVFSTRNVDVEETTFNGNVAQSGAGVYTTSYATLHYAMFSDNLAEERGGALYTGQKVDIDNSQFKNNTSLDRGGAVFSVKSASITDSTFEDNTATVNGGAVYVEENITCTYGTFINNSAGNRTGNSQSTKARGGAMFIYDGGSLEMYNSTAERNHANWNGGVVYTEGPAGIHYSNFSRNSAGGSGGVLFTRDYLNSDGSNFVENTVEQYGGAVYVEEDSVIEGASFINNSAGSGGAVYSNSLFELNRTTLTSNYAEGAGGAVRASRVRLVDTTINCNRASRGAAVALFGFVLNMDDDSSISNNEGECATIYFENGLQCKAEDVNNFCECDWHVQEVRERCGSGAECDSSRTFGSVWGQPCLCQDGKFYREGSGCLACSTCGRYEALQECSSRKDTICDCPEDKTGPECQDNCELPANCKYGDTSVCDHSQVDMHQGTACRECNEGYYRTDKGSCSVCTQCGTGDGDDVSRLVQECTEDSDTVCVCPTGQTGTNCAVKCELPPGCSEIDVSTSTCEFDILDRSKGIKCTRCSDDYYLPSDTKQCEPYTRCGDDEFQSAAPTNVSDRVCTRATECDVSQGEYTAINLTATADAVCKPCTSAEHCAVQVSTCSEFNNIVCSKCEEDYSGTTCTAQAVAFVVNDEIASFDEYQFRLQLYANLGPPVELSDIVVVSVERGSVIVNTELSLVAVDRLNEKFLASATRPVQGVTMVTVAKDDPVTTGEETYESQGNLSAGVIVLIVVVVSVIIGAVVAFLVYRHVRRRRQRQKKDRIHPLFNLPPTLLRQINDPISVQVRAKARSGDEAVEYSKLKKVQRLGGGNYGEVWCCILTDASGHHTSPVAIKELNATYSLDSVAVEVFMQEANLMRRMKHTNVLDCIAICHGPPACIVMDVMILGDMHTYLRSQFDRDEPVTVGEKYFFAYQIASGMAYLAKEGLVHRDLATRNCMLTRGSESTFGYPTVKVADFGLSRTLDQDSSFYVMGSATELPVRWLSPRAMLENRFSSESDIWSFGVTLWEIFSNAEEVPYRGKNVYEILQFLQSGGRLSKPHQCPKDAYDVMTNCWNIVPEHRPSFDQLVTEIATLFVPHSGVLVEVEVLEGKISTLVDARKRSKISNDSFVASSMPSRQGSDTVEVVPELYAVPDAGYETIDGCPQDYEVMDNAPLDAVDSNIPLSKAAGSNVSAPNQPAPRRYNYHDSFAFGHTNNSLMGNDGRVTSNTLNEIQLASTDESHITL